jgi:hypothetical protein
MDAHGRLYDNGARPDARDDPFVRDQSTRMFQQDGEDLAGTAAQPDRAA